MNIDVYALEHGSLQKKQSLELSPGIFNLEYNEGLVHQVITSLESKLRAGTRATKNRSAKRGGGKKPWRQKGTGRARAGTRRSPIWVGGGHTFAREPYDYAKGIKINKKMYRKAMHVILSRHIKDGTLTIIDQLELDQPKTKAMLTYKGQLGLDTGLMVVEELSMNMYLASRNLHDVYVCETLDLDPYVLFRSKRIIMTKTSLEQYEQEYAA